MPGSWTDIPQNTRDKYRREVFKRANNECELKLPGTWVTSRGAIRWCTGKAEHVHHINGVEMGKLDIRNMKASCAPCNLKTGEPLSKGNNPRPVFNTQW